MARPFLAAAASTRPDRQSLVTTCRHNQLASPPASVNRLVRTDESSPTRQRHDFQRHRLDGRSQLTAAGKYEHMLAFSFAPPVVVLRLSLLYEVIPGADHSKVEPCPLPWIALTRRKKGDSPQRPVKEKKTDDGRMQSNGAQERAHRVRAMWRVFPEFSATNLPVFTRFLLYQSRLHPI